LVTALGSCRAGYSATASLSSSSRVFLIRRARRSARRTSAAVNGGLEA
jgi:hypothetical protein